MSKDLRAPLLSNGTSSLGEGKGTPEKRSGVIEHTIKLGDTLQGVALLYGIKPQDLKRANKLWNDNIHIRKSLLVPVEYSSLPEERLRVLQGIEGPSTAEPNGSSSQAAVVDIVDDSKHKLPTDASNESMQSYLAQLDSEVASIKANLDIDKKLQASYGKGKRVERSGTLTQASERQTIATHTRDEPPLVHTSVHLSDPRRQDERWGASLSNILDVDKRNIEYQRRRMEQDEEEMFSL